MLWREGRTNVLAGAIAGSPNDGYLCVQIDSKLYKVHNIVWVYFNGPIPDGMIVDHANGDSFHNDIDNLRIATDAQNNHNAKKRSGTSSKYKGVHFNKQSGTWRASIRINGKVKYIGNFADEYAAHLAWCAVAKEAHGDFFRAS